jgi:hypothetical protein
VDKKYSLALKKLAKSKLSTISPKVTQDFGKWMKRAIKEDTKILDELA